jgi:hypothetical protein
MSEAFEKPVDTRKAEVQDLFQDGYIITGCEYYLKTERFGYLNLKTNDKMNAGNFLTQIKEGRIFI